jgi:hypothetical protein
MNQNHAFWFTSANATLAQPLGKRIRIEPEVLWRDTASKLGLSSKEIGRMESAFDHEDLRLACSIE